MKRAGSTLISRMQINGSDHHISGIDYYQIITSVLMVVLGVIILSRSLSAGITLMSALVGAGFLALGCYRLKFVIKFLRERRKCNHR
jgi:uncharacterized BrkB/YihY/UPF0761 family membrane protein